jgi:hypothetical protein
VHFGVDADTGLVHSVVSTAAHMHDVTQFGLANLVLAGWRLRARGTLHLVRYRPAIDQAP